MNKSEREMLGKKKEEKRTVTKKKGLIKRKYRGITVHWEIYFVQVLGITLYLYFLNTNGSRPNTVRSKGFIKESVWSNGLI